jgi:hypothetical protein
MLLYPSRPVLDTPGPLSTRFALALQAAPRNDSLEVRKREEGPHEHLNPVRDPPIAARFDPVSELASCRASV